MELSINEEWALKVVQYYDLRVLLRRWRPEGSVRRRVAAWMRCSPASQSVRADPLDRRLRAFFLITLGLAVINIILQCGMQTDLYRFSGIWQKEVVIIFAAVALVTIFMTLVIKSIGSAPPRKEEVKTISALIQHI